MTVASLQFYELGRLKDAVYSLFDQEHLKNDSFIK